MNNKHAKSDSKLVINFVRVWPAIRMRACAGCEERRGIPIYFANTTIYDQTIDPCKRCPIMEGNEIMTKAVGYRKAKSQKDKGDNKDA